MAEELAALSLVFANRVDQVREPDSDDFFPDCHAIFFCDAPRRQVFWADERDETVDGEVRESKITAGERGFSGEALVPMIAADVVADLDFVCVVDFLNDEAQRPWPSLA